MKIKLVIILAIAFGFFLNVYSCKEETFYQGHSIYDSICANCHMEDGTGLKGLIPPLAGSDYLKNNQLEVGCIIRHGMEGEVVVNGKIYNQPMAGIPYVTDTEIANIINYINNAWGNDYGMVDFKKLRVKLKECAAEEERKRLEERAERIKKMNQTD
jgi:mono/diheme cytochrome c family protein